MEVAFATLAQRRPVAIIIATDPFLGNERNNALAARYKLPIVYFDRSQVAAGGVMSYGASLKDSFRQAGVYVGRILKGDKPGNLPVMQPTKFELVINLKAATTLGLRVSQDLLSIADEIIE